MATITPPYPFDSIGQAAFEKLDDFEMSFFLNGSFPMLTLGIPYVVANGVTLSPLAVVGFDASGHLTPATTGSADPADDVQAIGVVTQGITGNGTQAVPTFRTGHFEMTALVFDASFDTDAKKATAFEGAPSPTQIMVSKR